jgi:hypothetical protein
MKVPFNIELSLKRSIRAIATAVFAVVLTSGAAFAQSEEGAGEPSSESKLMIGFKSGINLSDIRTSGGTEYFTSEAGQKEFAPQIHVFGRYNFTKWIGAELELGWTQNAFTLYGGDGSTNTFRANNFQANALLNVRIPVLSVYHPRFYIGPSYNLNAYTYQRVTGQSAILPTAKIDKTYDVTNAFVPHDFGVVVGTGLQFDVKFATLLLDARYRHGITRTIDAQAGYRNNVLSTVDKGHLSDVAFMVGLGFAL